MFLVCDQHPRSCAVLIYAGKGVLPSLQAPGLWSYKRSLPKISGRVGLRRVIQHGRLVQNKVKLILLVVSFSCVFLLLLLLLFYFCK